MASRILFKRNSNSNVAPSAGALVQGEFALNTADGKVFLKKEDNSVLDITKTIFERDTSITTNDNGGVNPSTISARVDNSEKFNVNSVGTNFVQKVTMRDQKEIQFNDATNTNFVTIKAPDNVEFSYDLKLPARQPIDRSILALDGNGNLEWGSPDSFGGNRVYVSDRKGDDANDGVNAPVRSLKRGAQIAASLGLRPLIDPGVSAFNAKRLLESNRSFIQSQVIKWIDANFVNFTFDVAEFTNDFNLVIDAVGFDFALGTNFNAVTTGLSFRRANREFLRVNQILQITSAILRAQQEGLGFITNPTALSRYNLAFGEIIDILENEDDDDSTDAIFYPNPTGVDVNRSSAKDKLQANREFLRAEVIAWINTNFSDFTYDTNKFRQDTGLLIDAVGFDMVLDTNYNSVVAGRTYLEDNRNLQDRQLIQTIAAFQFAKTQALESVSADPAAVASITLSFDEVLDILNNAQGDDSTDAIVFNALPGADQNNIDAKDQLQTNRSFLADAVAAYINKQFTGYVYEGLVKETSEQELGFIIDAARYDAALGTNYNAVTIGLSYQRATNAYILADQNIQTLAAIRFAKTQSLIAVAANGTAVTRVTAVYDEIIDIFQNGVVGTNTAADALVFPNPSNAAQNTINAKNQLINNKAFLQDEVIAYINANTPLPAGYNQTLYRRDVGFILDGLTYDLIYSGNSASVAGARAYFAGQSTADINAYTHLQSVITNVVQGIVVTPSVGNTTPQQTVGAATTAEAALINLNLQLYIDVITAGNTSGLPTPTFPNLAWVNANIVAATNTLVSSKTSIVTATSNFLTTTFDQFSYDSDIRKRDTRFIVDALTHDILYGGNTATRIIAGTYWVGTTSQVSDQIFQTVNAYEYLSTIVVDVLAGVNVTPSQDRVVFTKGSGSTDAFTITSWSVNTLVLEATGNSSGTAFLAKFTALDGTEPYDIYVNGVDVDVSGTSIVSNTVTLTTSKTLIETWGASATAADIVNISIFEAFSGASQDSVTHGAAGTAEINESAALISIITNVVGNGLSVLPSAVNPDLSLSDAGLLVSRTELVADRQSIIDSTIDFIQTTFQDFTYNNAKCSRDVGFIVDALTYDILYQGNSATVRAADAYWITLDGSTFTTQVPGQQSVTAQAIDRLNFLVDNVVRGVLITDTYQLIETQDTSGPNADVTIAGELTALLSIITTVIIDGIGTLPAVVFPDTSSVAGAITANLAAFRITNRTTIIDNVIIFISDTFTGFIYDEAICSRDTGLIIDAVILDLILSGNERTREAGLAYYEAGNTSAALVVGQQLFETVEANKHIKRISKQIVQNQTISPFFTPVGAEPTQIKFPSITVESADIARISELFDVVIGIFQGDPAPALVANQFQQIPITISVAAGDFFIDNPVIIPDLCSVVGDSLRSVVVRPLNANKDMFRIRNGAYMTGFTFRDGLDANLVPSYTFDWCVAFDDPDDSSVDRTGYFGLRNDKPRITQSPYIQNCSIISFLGGNGIWVDGSKIRDPNISPPGFNIEQENPVQGDIPPQGKSMVANAFTMVSFGGTGWLVTNDGYAQVVSCFQIFCLNGSYCQSGGYLSITNSATNFGLYALRSSGFSPNSFVFDRAFVASTGTDGGRITLTTIGQTRVPTAQYVLKFRNPSTDVDVTNNFKSATTEILFDAALDVIPSADIITIPDHGLLNGDSVIYESDYLLIPGNEIIPGLIDSSIFYVSVISLNTIRLFNDDGLSFPVDIEGFGVGTQRLVKNVEEFFVEVVTSSHNVYQELELVPGPAFVFGIGAAITGTTGAFTNNAFVVGFNPTTRKLIISNELTTVGEEQQRVKFTTLSTITADQTTFTAIGIVSVIERTNLFTATFKTNSTKTASEIQSPGGTIGLKCNFHRPSILNSSSHTWEYAGSGTDYNALPQNGGLGIPEYEQFTELPGRVYSSGTDENGNFKVGDFIKAENNTGKITFRTEVTVGQLNVLRLSLSSIEISAISNDIGLGDNEIGGASDSRLPTQRSVRLFINNRLGNVLDKAVSTNSVAGALVQLNSQGQINADLIPPQRGITTFTTTRFEGRLALSDQIPAVQVNNGDNVGETYLQQDFTLISATSFAKGDVITQSGNTGRGIVKAATTSSTAVTLVDITGVFAEDSALDGTDTLIKNGVSISPIYPISLSAVNTIVDSFFLNNDNDSQFLLLDGTGFVFTVGNNVTSAVGLAEGEITEYREGVLTGVNQSTLNGGSLYTPASGSQIYTDVSLTNVIGSGTGATADITVTNGAVSDIRIVTGGTGYVVGNTVSVSSANVGGSGSGFQITVNRADARLYVDLIGNKAKFNATSVVPDFVSDNNAVVKTISDLAQFTTFTFNAQAVGAGGDVNTSTARITLTAHGLTNGDAVIYSNQANSSIGGLINNRGYFIKVIDANTIELYNNYAVGAADQVLLTASSTGNHTLTRNTVTIGSTSLCFFRIATHGFTAGDPVLLAGADLPAGLVTGTYYFVGSVSTNTFTLHTLRSNALVSVGGTTSGKVTVTDVGSGSATLTAQNVPFIGTVNDSSKSPDNYGNVSITTIDASNIVSGVIASSRLAGSGQANTQTFLRGDSTFALAVQGIRKVTGSAISLTGDSYVDGVNTVFFDIPVLDVEKVDGDSGDTNFSNFGVARYNKIQFTVGRALNVPADPGTISIKDGVIDAGFLSGQPGTFYTNPDNLSKAVPILKGGTGLTVYNQGDLIVASAGSALTQLAIGPINSVLTSDGATPSWSTTLSLGGDLTAPGAIFNGNVNSTSTVTGAVRITGGIGMTGNAFVGGNLTVTGAINFNSSLSITGDDAVITLSPGGTGTVSIQPAGVLTLGTLGVQTTLTGNLSAVANQQTINFSPTGTTSAITINSAGTLTLGAAAAGGINVTTDLTSTGDIAVNGGDITTTAATFNLVNTTATTVNFAGAGTAITIGANAVGGTIIRHNLTVTGDLIVNGTNATIAATSVTIADNAIQLAQRVTPTNAVADGGGIILKGTTDHTILWDIANTNWTLNEHVNIPTGKSFKVNNVSVLSATELGSSVTGSSLTSVGTVTSGTWNASVITGQHGGTGVANTGKTITLSGDLTTSGAFSTAITVTNTTAVTLPTSGTLVGSSDSGTVTNTMLAGNIANSKLSNSSITLNGSLINLGDTATITAQVSNALTVGTGLVLDSGTTYNGSAARTISIATSIATLAGSQVLTNKTFTDSSTLFQDDVDNSKKMSFQLSSVATGTTRTLTVPNVSGTIVTTGDTGTVSNTMLAGSIANAKLANSTISGVALGSNLNGLTAGSFLTYTVGTTFNGSAASTLAVNAVSANTANTVVARDASGNFTAGTITAALTGLASTATAILVSSTSFAGSTSSSANTVALRDASQDIFANLFRGTATTARYADLAENYLGDVKYAAGTVVMFGGDAEITLATDGTRRVAGVVSTNPAHLMNDGLKGETVAAIALQGRVLCKITGKIRKGDMVVAAGNGHARAEENPKLGQVIGKALEDFDGDSGVIEVVVGRM